MIGLFQRVIGSIFVRIAERRSMVATVPEPPTQTLEAAVSPPDQRLLDLLQAQFHIHNSHLVEEGWVEAEELEAALEQRMMAYATMPAFYLRRRLLIDLPPSAFGNA